VAELVQSINSIAADDFWLLVIVSVIACLGGFWWWFRNIKRVRLIEDTPTSKCRSAAQGYVELVGIQKLMPGDPIKAPLTGKTCTWWYYSIEERRRSGGRNSSSKWVTVESETSGSLFLIEDETGKAIINPDGAHVIPSATDSWRGSSRRPSGPAGSSLFGGRYRYTEKRMHDHDALYAIGFFQSQSRQYTAFDRQNETGALLREWKKDPAMMRRFDADRDGEISVEEWQQAQDEARRIVDARAREAALESDIHIMSCPPDGRPLILSVLPEDAMTRRFRWHAIAGLAGFFIGGAGGVFLLTTRIAF
jgi:hypothetical protein